MLTFVQTEPLSTIKNGNIFVVRKSLAKEICYGNKYPKNIYVNCAGNRVWAEFSSYCRLSNQLVYKTPQNFVVLEL